MAAKANKKENAGMKEWMYEIVRQPLVTEKSTMGSEHNQVSFRVPLHATKPQIREAVETLFKVKVKGVNTLISKGKTKAFRGTKAFRSDAKKAIITLEEGQTIDIGTGI